MAFLFDHCRMLTQLYALMYKLGKQKHPDNFIEVS